VAEDNLDAFDRELAAAHMRGQWQVDRLLQRATLGPMPAGVPFRWRWHDIRAKLERACEVMPDSLTARRNISFVNPGFQPGRGVTTHTITAGMQIVKPREVAETHRHTIAALRFSILGGDGVYTVVDGRACPMEPYDLVFTPAWSWHDHHNETDAPAVWLDVLDSPLVLSLNQIFFERNPGRTQAIAERSDGSGAVRFPWRRVREQLDERRGGGPSAGIAIPYLDPRTGRSPLPALRCSIRLLRPGEETASHRQTSSVLHFVIQGDGVTVAGDCELAWGQHDTLAIPNWTTHRHLNLSRTEEALLFTVDDSPLLDWLGLYREERAS
jgi:1-hydroxy-2-naphthoate dioxygenase